jgi:hypothetical protein
MGVGRGATTLPCKRKIVEKPPRNLAGFCGEGQGLSWAVEPRKEERDMRVWSGFIWLSIRTSEYGNEPSIFMKSWEFFD